MIGSVADHSQYRMLPESRGRVTALRVKRADARFDVGVAGRYV
jgi:hypothetical protein